MKGNTINNNEGKSCTSSRLWAFPAYFLIPHKVECDAFILNKSRNHSGTRVLSLLLKPMTSMILRCKMLFITVAPNPELFVLNVSSQGHALSKSTKLRNTGLDWMSSFSNDS